MEQKTNYCVGDIDLIVKKIAEKVAIRGNYEFHGGSYSDGQLVQTIDGNHFNIVDIILRKENCGDGILDIEVWSSITSVFSVSEKDLTAQSLKNILKEMNSKCSSQERQSTKELDREKLLQETIAMLSADIYEKLYERLNEWGTTVETIVTLAKVFEERLNWQVNDERDYIFELEKFEKEVLSKCKK